MRMQLEPFGKLPPVVPRIARMRVRGGYVQMMASCPLVTSCCEWSGASVRIAFGSVECKGWDYYCLYGPHPKKSSSVNNHPKNWSMNENIMTFQDFHFMESFYMCLSRQRYTFRELLAAYSSQYSPEDLGDYWRDAMASELVIEGKKSPVVVHVRVSWILGAKWTK